MVEGVRVDDAAPPTTPRFFQWLAMSALGAAVFVALTRETHCCLCIDSDT
jgi:hypothetical protein